VLHALAEGEARREHEREHPERPDRVVPLRPCDVRPAEEVVSVHAERGAEEREADDEDRDVRVLARL
jgi:hypothetical protein